MTTKPFRAEEFVSNEKTPVVTNSRGPIRILCTDRDHPLFPIVAMTKEQLVDCWAPDDLFFLIPDPPYEPSHMEILDFATEAVAKYDISTRMFSSYMEMRLYTSVGPAVARHALILLHQQKSDK